jgi:rhodanese-related sulfurtransferase
MTRRSKLVFGSLVGLVLIGMGFAIDARLQARVTPEELLARIEAGEPVTIIDVRSRAEYESGHVPGAIHLPFWQAVGRSSDLDERARPFVVYCGHGPRASLARLGLRLAGVAGLQSLTGHYSAWSAAGLPSE